MYSQTLHFSLLNALACIIHSHRSYEQVCDKRDPYLYYPNTDVNFYPKVIAV